jgi:hypothetical protein
MVANTTTPTCPVAECKSRQRILLSPFMLLRSERYFFRSGAEEGGCMKVEPVQDDVVVRKKAGDSGVSFVLGTRAAPEQLTWRTHDEAVAHALAFAKRHRIGAWFVSGGDELVLLGTFRQEPRNRPADPPAKRARSTKTRLPETTSPGTARAALRA